MQWSISSCFRCRWIGEKYDSQTNEVSTSINTSLGNFPFVVEWLRVDWVMHDLPILRLLLLLHGLVFLPRHLNLPLYFHRSFLLICHLHRHLLAHAYTCSCSYTIFEDQCFHTKIHPQNQMYTWIARLYNLKGERHSAEHLRTFSHVFVHFSSIPVAVRSKAWVCGRSLTGIVGLNPTEGMEVCLLWVLCVVR